MKRTLLSFSLLLISAISLMGQSAAELKVRMAERLPVIDELKQQLLVGENNQAYLSILGNVSESNAIVIQEENADRRTVYTMLSKQTGASLDKIQVRRAQQLAEIAKSGTKYQTPEGDWVVKP